MPQYPNYYNPQAFNTTSSFQNSQQYIGLKGRPVTSIEEVRAAAVDFDGTVQFFPDLANGKIYTKQCNLDGTASLNMYELKEIPVAPTGGTANYVTREEFEATLNKIKEMLMTKIPQKEETLTQDVSEFKF